MVRPNNLNNVELAGTRGKIARFIEHHSFINFIAGLIVLNAITLGLETSDTVTNMAGGFLLVIDQIILWIFVAEITLKLYTYRLSFFRAGWNVFDFLIVGISLLTAGGALNILRALRIFRVLRLMSIVPQMRRVVTALFLSLPGMTSIVAVLMIIFYVAAVLATKIFGADPDPAMEAMFGTIGSSMYTLFTVMTLEGWSENIAEPTMKIFPWAWAFFVPFIIITSFAVLNLFIGIIVDAMNIIQGKDLEKEGDDIIAETHKQTEIIHKDIDVLRAEVAELKGLLVKALK
jgi:voltage-gated sodium channel